MASAALASLCRRMKTTLANAQLIAQSSLECVMHRHRAVLATHRCSAAATASAIQGIWAASATQAMRYASVRASCFIACVASNLLLGLLQQESTAHAADVHMMCLEPRRVTRASTAATVMAATARSVRSLSARSPPRTRRLMLWGRSPPVARRQAHRRCRPPERCELLPSCIELASSLASFRVSLAVCAVRSAERRVCACRGCQ
jgi:hypothetical protein